MSVSRRPGGMLAEYRLRLQGDGQGEFPVRDHLLMYAQNLLRARALQRQVVEYVLNVLSEEALGSFSRFMEGRCGEHRRVHRLEDHPGPEDKPTAPALYKDVIDRLTHAVVHAGAADQEAAVQALDAFLRNDMTSPVPARYEAGEYGRISPQLDAVRDTFSLSGEETRILALCYCYQESQALQELLDCENNPVQLRLASLLTGVPLQAVRAALRAGGMLIQSGLIEREVRGVAFHFELHGYVQDYLNGLSELSFLERFCRRAAGETYQVDSFQVSAEARTVVLALLKSDRPCHILLHGEPGTGKTEFARAVARECGKDACFVKHEASEDQPGRRLAVQVVNRTVPPAEGVAVVDEADWLINTGRIFSSHRDPFDKGWLNLFLESSSAQFIWITNDLDFIDASVLRRFTYHVRFAGHTRRQREKAWAAALQDHPLGRYLPEDVIPGLAAAYRVNVAQIDQALDVLRRVVDQHGSPDRDFVRRHLEHILQSRHRLMHNGECAAAPPPSGRYDASWINVDADVDLFTRSLAEFFRRGEARSGRLQAGFTALFWGKPGTGKTAFARHLARVTGQELLCRRASDLLSPFVGCTERNIRRAFEEAEETGAMLLLDEADSLFTRRETAGRSWEVTRTNELLNQMNDHAGALICCTNLPHLLDEAALRRFDWKIEFRPLDQRGRLEVFARYFCAGGEQVGPAVRRGIASLRDLTFGDVAAVWKRTRFAPPGSLSHQDMVALLEKELACRTGRLRGRIGFNPD